MCGQVEIGYGVAAPYRGHGYATEAVAGLCRWLVDEAGATRLVAVDVLTDNVASRRMLEKVGFTITHESDRSVSYALNA
jgi:RimJ/RimL family protein N-acetyltransferase